VSSRAGRWTPPTGPGGPGGPTGRRRGGERPVHVPRTRVLAALTVIGALALAARSAEIQVGMGPRLASAALAQRLVRIQVPATRGLILDASGQVLAGNVPTYDIVADPAVIPAAQVASEAAQLGPVLGQSRAAVEQALRRPVQFEYLAKSEPPPVAARIGAANLAGVTASLVMERVYGPGAVPGTTLAANLLGFVNTSGQGAYGLEGYYNRVLAGRPGYQTALQDALGNDQVLRRAAHRAAVPGRDLQTAIDGPVQYAVEKDLAQRVQAVHGSSGTMIVMNVRTGAIVAWADVPAYDANRYATTDPARFRDAGIADLYEPGSVMKVVTFAGALDDGAITPTLHFDETGVAVVGGYTIRDWDLRAHGWISMNYVLQDSLNVGAIHVENLEGAPRFYANMQRFGIGHPTGIDLAGEDWSSLPSLPAMSRVQLATSSFGQGVVVTPIEMLAAINTVANGGVWVQPHVVTAVTGGGRPPTIAHGATHRVISAAAARTLTQMMVGVVDAPIGSGFMARMWPTWRGEIAGKTGTASVALPTGGYGSQTIDSFTGFFPASDPQYSMLCIIRTPQVSAPLREGAFDAAPTFKQVAQVIIDEHHLLP